MMEELNALLESSKKVELTDGFDKIPDGDYDATIYTVGFTESKNTGNLMFKWEFIITGPKFAKAHEWKYTVLNKPENMKRLTTDLNKFGIKTDTMENIQNGLSDLLDVPVILSIKTTEGKDGKEGYRNISVNPADKLD